MSYDTAERLKGYLDGNQPHRDQMCLALLANDRRFSSVTPRQPYGGPDGGRDIEALYDKREKTFGAVGFINQANDSPTQKARLKRKFQTDLKRALEVESRLKVFIFFTNIQFTTIEKENLTNIARKSGITICEVWDRERLRIALDTTEGFCIRFQYLAMPLSEEEQASFFARWGTDIQSVISTGFQEVEKKLNQIVFYQEAREILRSLTVKIQLNNTYTSDVIGHFRIFCDIEIIQPHCELARIILGASDKSKRMMPDSKKSYNQELSGIKYGISRGSWHSTYNSDQFICSSTSASIGLDEVESIAFDYDRDSFIFRNPPYISVLDLNNAYFIFYLNKSLAPLLDSIILYANEYTIQTIEKNDFSIDETEFTLHEFPVNFSQEELDDPWIRIRPNNVSLFQINFHKMIPQKLFFPDQRLD